MRSEPPLLSGNVVRKSGCFWVRVFVLSSLRLPEIVSRGRNLAAFVFSAEKLSATSWRTRTAKAAGSPSRASWAPAILKCPGYCSRIEIFDQLPVFLGLREDKNAGEVVKEKATKTFVTWFA